MLEYIYTYWIKPTEPRLKNKSNIKKNFKKMLCMLLNKASYTEKPLYANEFTTPTLRSLKSGSLETGLRKYDLWF